MHQPSSRTERALHQWPALAGLVLLYLCVLGWGFAGAVGRIPMSLGEIAAVVLFLLLLALAETGLLVLVNAGLEAVTRRLRLGLLVDAGKALGLAAMLGLAVASLAKFQVTRVHLKVEDLWFAVTSFRQIAAEATGGELGSGAWLVGGVVAVALGLFAAFRLLARRIRSGQAPPLRAFVALSALALVGVGISWTMYPVVPMVARHLVPEVHWLTARGGGPGPPARELLPRDLPPGPIRSRPLPEIADYAPSGEAVRALNVVLVMLESIPWGRVGFTGAPPGTTPNLDRLAAESVVFSHAYSTSVHSDYAQMAILSSLFPRKYDRHDYYGRLDYPRTLLWDILGPAGWSTAMFSCQNESWGNMIRYLETPGLGLLRHSRSWPDAPKKGRGSESKVFEETPVTAWRRWLAAEGPEPYLAYLNFQATHFPYVIPPEAPRPFAPFRIDFPASFFRYPPERVPVMLNRFHNALHYADRWLGEVVATLEQRDEWDETILVVVSDHGEAFYEHGQPTHGTALYEEQVRSLWMMRLPGESPRVVAEPVTLLDVAPTVLSALGLPPHGNFQGRGDVLAPAYSGEGRPLFFTIQGVTAEDGVLLDGRKYMLNWDLRRHRMFDLEHDPGERRDVLPRQPAQAQRLQLLLADFLTAQLDYYRQRRWEEGLYPPSLP